MKKLKIIICLFAITSFFISSCDSYVNNIDPFIDVTNDSNLNTQSEINFLIIGLKGAMGSTGEGGAGIERMLWRAAGYSDEMINTVLGGVALDHATFVQDLPAERTFYQEDWNSYHYLRYLGDDLARRTKALDAAGKFTDTDLKNKALWWGNFVGGLMRMYLADHWGAKAIEGNTPGATITTKAQLEAGEYGAFFTSKQLHDLARAKFNKIKGINPDDVANSDKVLYSFIARTYLFDGMYTEAKIAAEKGLKNEDADFQIIHTDLFTNQMWSQSGRLDEILFSAHPRFAKYVLDDRKEGEIISGITQNQLDGVDDDGNPTGVGAISTRSLRGIEPNGLGSVATRNPRQTIANKKERIALWERAIVGAVNGIGTTVTKWLPFKKGAGYTQDVYNDRSQSFSIIGWEEMQLILAEVAIRASNTGTGLTHINNVRTSYGLDAKTMAQMTAYDNPYGGASSTGIAIKANIVAKKYTGAMGLLIEERDKTLWMRGTRLADQKRFKLWHLEGGSFFKYYMPLPRTEENVNPNVPK